jgi:hypothetical protein
MVKFMRSVNKIWKRTCEQIANMVKTFMNVNFFFVNYYVKKLADQSGKRLLIRFFRKIRSTNQQMVSDFYNPFCNHGI